MSFIETVNALKKQRSYIAMQWKQNPSERLFELWEKIDENLVQLGWKKGVPLR